MAKFFVSCNNLGTDETVSQLVEAETASEAFRIASEETKGEAQQ